MVKKWHRYFPKVKIFKRKRFVKSSYAKRKVSIFYVFLFVFSFCLTALVYVPVTSAIAPPGTNQVSANPQTLLQQGKAFYDAGQFAEAVTVLQQAANAFKVQGKQLQQAIALTNLALAYQQLGQWSEAQDAITSSLQLLQNANKTDPLKVKGAALDVQGQLYLAQGQPESALESFSLAATTYTQAGDDSGVIRSHVNQAQALQANGFYRRALDALQEVRETLHSLPDSSLKATGLRSLGNALRLVGSLDESENVLKESLAVAQRYGAMRQAAPTQSFQDTSAALLSLGNTARAKADIPAALNYYQQAAAVPTSPTTRVQAQLNQLSLLVEAGQFLDAQRLSSEIQPLMAELPTSRASVEARINFARSLMKLRDREDVQTFHQSVSRASLVAQQLSTAVQQAQIIQDPRAESYALGELGALYEQTEQLGAAQEMTQQALLVAQSINAPDIAYRWQWQLGRVLSQRGNVEDAIAAYTAAVETLQSLRGDLVSINPDVQFSFRESVEPVYRELVNLLLQPQAKQDNLAEARLQIEALQQAELINFFREDCLNAIPIQIDQVDQQAAVIYPIVLKDRLEVVLSLPKQPLRHYATVLPEAEVKDVFRQLRETLTPLSVNPQPNRGSEIEDTETDPTRSLAVLARDDCRSLGVEGRECVTPPVPQDYLPLAQQVYDWLIQPAEQDIAASEAKTLVFVLDSPMLNLPMAILHDGEQFLIENYAIAYTPGLQLIDPKPLTRGQLSALTGGLTEERQGFPALPFVGKELEDIKAEIPGELLLDEQFTSPAIESEIDAVPFPVIHLATHGQFSSKAEDTFILTWDDRLNIKQLNTLLQSRETGNKGAIELLVLSACQTAAGDERAALGLAGVAVRAGARSTLATLWFVNDQATAELMTRFYRELGDTTITKAEALRRAQVSLLKESQYQQPRLWAPYVLVGNWL